MDPTSDPNPAAPPGDVFLPACGTTSPLLRVLADACAALEEVDGDGGPWVGGPPGRWDLDDFAEIPSRGRSAESVMDAVVHVLRGSMRWHHPHTMHNVSPPVPLVSVAATTIATALNPNALWDQVSGGVLGMEQQMVRQFCDLVGWEEDAVGAVTFGGKACATYALRVALTRHYPRSEWNGLPADAAPVVLAAQSNHYTLEYVCALIGLGANRCRRLPTAEDGTLTPQTLENAIVAAQEAGERVIAIVLCGGDTLLHAIDPVNELMDVVDRLCPPGPERPLVYCDAVLGLPWLFARGWRDRITLDPKAASRLDRILANYAGIERVDAFGVDLHKLGVAPYGSSVFATRWASEWFGQSGRPELTPAASTEPGAHFMQHHTLEHSRSAAPIVSGWASLQVLGKEGYERYLLRLLDFAEALAEELVDGEEFEIINDHRNGFALVMWPRPIGGPASYADALAADASTVTAINAYVQGLFQSLAGMDGSTPIAITGYVPFKEGRAGIGVGALRMYPMSPYVDRAKVSDLARDIIARKCRLDRVHGEGVRPPDHVPR